MRTLSTRNSDMQPTPAYSKLIGEGIYNPPEPKTTRPQTFAPRPGGYRGTVYAIPLAPNDLKNMRRWRFELHYAGRIVARTIFAETVWNAWKCDVPREFCFDGSGRPLARSPREQEEHTRNWHAKNDAGFKVGDLVKRGERYAIVQAIRAEQVSPLRHRINLLLREVRLRTLKQGGRIAVTVKGKAMKAAWLWNDPNRTLRSVGSHWRKVV